MTLTADQLRGRVRVLIDGEEKFLRYGQGALAHLVDSLELGGLSELPSAIQSLDAKTLLLLVWSGRMWEQPDLKVEEVETWFYPLLPTYQSCLEAINLALWGEPEPDFGGSDDDPDPPKEETGTSQEPEVLQ
jgi:hypothetical protein